MAAPINNRGGRKDKLWRDALTVAVNRQDLDTMDKRTMLARIAEKCVNAALEGDIQAMKEIGDRLDGKPLQQTEVTADINIHDGGKDRLQHKLARFSQSRTANGSDRVTH